MPADKARLRRDQPEGAKVVVRRRVEVDQPLLPQLHHRDRGEGLGDRCDAKDGVLRDRRLRRDISEAVPVEPRQGSVTDHRDGQTGARPAVEDLSHRRHQRRAHRSDRTRTSCCSPLLGRAGDVLIGPLSFLTSPNECSEQAGNHLQRLPRTDRRDDADPALERRLGIEA